ncbi:glycosyltransferase family 4 protein [Spirosoma validum]|uniref:Glycosyltransferase family 4 protein n=1 Tax=Spirosoma validum TaxID=2771355 RepID=A0A927B7T3_9BACT|nr:glycosyltransferase family 1 protein [Spirosoma validum]MBD2756781.1 glycosyltransferase family 4 protein [Spirosoma validum]
MKFPHTGLYYYCQNLGEAINQLLADEHQPLMQMYLPPRKKLILSPEPYHLIERKWHKFIQPFLMDCRIWHAPFQSGRILPNKKRFPKLKVVLTVHDLNVLHEGKPEAVQQKSLAHTQSLIDQSDAVVCISEFTKNDVLTHCSVGDKPIQVIYNGQNKLPDAIGDVVAYKPKREFLLGIGYLNQKKNFHVLLPLLQDNPDLELIVIGHQDDPDYVARMEQSAQKMGVQERMHLLGRVSESDKVWYLRHCKALVHPSLAEGFGLPVIEAMQFGKPVFLSTLTSLPEVGGSAAFYFPDFEASTIQEVYQQGMRAYGTTVSQEQIIQNAARFDWNKSAQHYLALYQSLME